MVDNIADHRILEVGALEARRELEDVRHKLDDTLAGRPPRQMLWQRLYAVHRTFGLDPYPLHELIEGAAWDLSARRVRTDADLLQYAGFVGGSVGAMMLPFLLADEMERARVEPYARDLGVAMQITNIVRDIGEDLRLLGRVYIPESMLNDYGIPRAGLAGPHLPPGYPHLMERMMKMAETRFLSGHVGIGSLPTGVQYGIRNATRLYREILNEVRALNYDNLNNRAYVSLTRKLGLLVADTYYSRKSKLLALRPNPEVVDV